MKKLFLLFTCAFVALSCEEIQDYTDTKGHGLVFSEGDMEAIFLDKGDTKNYKFYAELDWSVEVSADWVEVNPTSGSAGENKIQIKVDKNTSDQRRVGYVDIYLSDGQSGRIELEQLAVGENIEDGDDNDGNDEADDGDGDDGGDDDGNNEGVEDGDGVEDNEEELVATIANNEIWYTNGSATDPTIPYNTSVFGANIISNTYDAEKECWVISFDGDVTQIGYYAFFSCTNLVNLTLPNSLTYIGIYAFANCNSLIELNIPNGVTVINSRAFAMCRSLRSVNIPESVMHIGAEAFILCNSLVKFTGKFASADGQCLVVDNTLNSFALGSGVTQYAIPSDVTKIGWGSVANCESLTSVIIPNGVTIIEQYAFEKCANLSSVVIGESVVTIDQCAFSGCASLTSVIIPDRVKEIFASVFYGCSSLKSVTIGAGVTIMADAVFANCASLKSVYCKAVTPPDAGNFMFDTNAEDFVIYVPAQSVEAYKSADGWNQYSDVIVGGSF